MKDEPPEDSVGVGFAAEQIVSVGEGKLRQDNPGKLVRKNHGGQTLLSMSERVYNPVGSNLAEAQ